MANQLKHNFVYQLLLSSTQVLLPLVTYPYVTRVLGPENLGKTNYIDFVAQIFMILAAFGIPFYGTREVAKLRHQPAQRSMLVKELALIHCCFAAVCAALFAIIMRQQLEYERLLCLLAIGNICISAFSFEWFIMGMEQFRFAAIRTIIIRVLMLGACFLMVRNSNDYPFFFAIFTGAMLLTAIANFTAAMTQQSPATVPLQITRHLKPLFHFFLTASAIGIYEYVGTILLEKFVADPAVIGYYTMMHKMVLVFLAMLIAFSGVLSPRISYLISHQQHDEAKRYINRFIDLLVTLGIPACCGIFIFAPELVITVAGEKFIPAIPILRILCFLPLAVGPTNVFCNQVLVAFHQEKKFMIVALLGCIFSISANILLVPYFTASGTAWASIITEASIAVVSGWMAARYMKLQLNIAVLTKTLVVTSLFWPLATVLRWWLQSPVIILACGIGSCTLVYFICQVLILKNTSLLEVYAYIQQLLDRKQKQ